MGVFLSSLFGYSKIQEPEPASNHEVEVLASSGVIDKDHLKAIKICIILMFIVELILTLFLFYRQCFHMRTVLDVPSIIQRFDNGLYLEYDLQFSRQYSSEKMVEYCLQKLYITLLWIVVISFDWISHCWTFTKELSSSLFPKMIDPIISKNMTFVMTCVLLNELVLIPMYSCHIIRKVKYGRWKVTEFFVEYFKNLVTNLLPIGVAAGFVTWALMVLDQTSLQYQITTLIILIIIYVLIYPSIDIWFLIKDRTTHHQRSRHSPRSRSSRILELRLRSLCDRVGFPRDHLILFPSGSPQTSAFYYGFLGFQRIIVFQGHQEHFEDLQEDDDDTSSTSLSLNLTPKETEAIVAHELGHWHHSHSDQTVLFWHFIKISTFILIYIFRSNPNILQVFRLPLGPEEGSTYFPGSFVVYFIVLRIYTNIFDILSQIHSQITEEQADAYAAIQLGYYKNFAKGLIKIVLAQQTTFPSADTFYQLCYHNHPSLVQRLKLIYRQFKRVKRSNYH